MAWHLERNVKMMAATCGVIQIRSTEAGTLRTFLQLDLFVDVKSLIEDCINKDINWSLNLPVEDYDLNKGSVIGVGVSCKDLCCFFINPFLYFSHIFLGDDGNFIYNLGDSFVQAALGLGCGNR